MVDYYGIEGKSTQYLGRTQPYVVGPDLPRTEASGALALRAYLMPGSGVGSGVRYGYDLDVARLDPHAVSRLGLLLRAAEGTPAHLRLLQLGGIGHVVSLHDLAEDGLVAEAELPGIFPEPIRLWRVPGELPRVFVVGGWRIASGLEGLRVLLDAGFDPRVETLLEAGEPLPPPAGFSGVARVVESRPGVWTIDVETSHDGHLVVLDSFAPGWRASVDGRSAPVRRAFTAFRAVPVPAGRHRVELRYRPRALAIGTGLALLAVALAAGATVSGRRGHARPGSGGRSSGPERRDEAAHGS